MLRLLIKPLIIIVKFFDKRKGLFKQIKLFHYLNNQLDTEVVVEDIIFDCSSITQLKRAKTFLSKEPDTLEWIKTYIHKSDIFYDVGACVGEFSLYAAKKCGAIVFAFEPSALNYAVLSKNIYLNRLDKKITALNLALHDNNVISYLQTSRNKYLPGKSHNQFCESDNDNFTIKDSTYSQGSLGLKLDYLIEKFKIPPPDHIKIDVDGNEGKIINGMDKVLTTGKVKTIACELDLTISESKNIISKIESYGFIEINALSEKKYQNNTISTRNRFFIKS